MLAIEGMLLRRRGFTLGPLSLRVAAGEYFALLGPSGAGKTTLIECIAGFHPRVAGTLHIDGRDVSHAPPADRRVGVVYQDAALFPTMSVADNLAFPLRIAGVGPGRCRARVDQLATTLRLRHRLDASPASLSGGEARRAALGRALAADRRLMLLDEPLAALEPGLRQELRAEIAGLHRDLGLTVLHVSHDLEEVAALASRAAVMIDGDIAQIGAPSEVFARPASATVARYLGVRGFIEGEADPAGGAIRTASGLIRAPVRAAGPVRAQVSGGVLCAEAGEDRLQVRVRGVDGHDRAPKVLVAYGATEAPEETLLEATTLQGFAETPRRGDVAWLDLSAAHWRIYSDPDGRP